MSKVITKTLAFITTLNTLLIFLPVFPRNTVKPVLHGRHWVAITPGTPGGILVMLAEYGRLSLAEAPSGWRTEAANFNSYQMRSSFGGPESYPGRILLNEAVPAWVGKDLAGRGYELRFEAKNIGTITAFYFDRRHESLWGGASHYGVDYGIAW